MASKSGRSSPRLPMIVSSALMLLLEMLLLLLLELLLVLLLRRRLAGASCFHRDRRFGAGADGAGNDAQAGDGGPKTTGGPIGYDKDAGACVGAAIDALTRLAM